jgi:carboxymethylenebutenolidase
MQDELHAETIRISGHGGDEIEAYHAAPLGDGPFGGVVMIHHMPGYDRETKESARRLAAAGYHVVVPNLYWREAPGASPDDAAATARAAGGVPDERLVGDVGGAADFIRGLPTSNGRIGTIGYCSGGRQSFLCACSLEIDAAVDCYGAFVVNAPPEGMGMLARPIIDLAPQMSCPILGLFGADDKFPTPEETAEIEKALQAAGKEYEFHTYEGAGHAFFSVDRPAAYRAEAAVDGWRRVEAFFAEHLAS